MIYIYDYTFSIQKYYIIIYILMKNENIIWNTCCTEKIAIWYTLHQFCTFSYILAFELQVLQVFYVQKSGFNYKYLALKHGE